MKILNKFIKALAVCALIGSSAFALTEGVEYKTLEKPLNVPQGSVTKVFSYACQHCYKFDKGVTPKIFKEIEGVKFIPYHLKTKGDLGETVSNILAALIALDEQKDVSLLGDKSLFKKAKFAIYKSTHDNHENFEDKEKFIQMALKAAKVSKSDYEAALNSPRAKEILASWDDSYDVAVINGVPAFVVNGKYLVELKAASSMDEMIRIIKELLAK